MSSNGPALLLIDVQKGFDDPSWGERNNPSAESNIAALLDAWRSSGAPIVHVRHSSTEPDGVFRGAGFEYKPEAEPRPGEFELTKEVNSAFIGTGLEELLRTRGIDSVVIAGLTTDHCCSTTARMGANIGFRVVFVADATATFAREAPGGRAFDAETMHQSALASLHDEFADVVDTAEAIAVA